MGYELGVIAGQIPTARKIREEFFTLENAITDRRQLADALLKKPHSKIVFAYEEGTGSGCRESLISMMSDLVQFTNRLDFSGRLMYSRALQSGKARPEDWNKLYYATSEWDLPELQFSPTVVKTLNHLLDDVLSGYGKQKRRARGEMTRYVANGGIKKAEYESNSISSYYRKTSYRRKRQYAHYTYLYPRRAWFNENTLLMYGNPLSPELLSALLYLPKYYYKWLEKVKDVDLNTLDFVGELLNPKNMTLCFGTGTGSNWYREQLFWIAFYFHLERFHRDSGIPDIVLSGGDWTLQPMQTHTGVVTSTRNQLPLYNWRVNRFTKGLHRFVTQYKDELRAYQKEFKKIGVDIPDSITAAIKSAAVYELVKTPKRKMMSLKLLRK